ncbi:hypothetical protein HRbin22_00250 [Candidatus Thermoflexus japonica]|uniref:Uncharacterized protein n=1 Tax=Candidatus Thermoflexus japonica TaxID=2035417 RepID=A0A2H5Y3K4_9CHLR|nr:hypothetical protein HRbin22_00250 [Candidatus Thermoflexus japonica]
MQWGRILRLLSLLLMGLGMLGALVGHGGAQTPPPPPPPPWPAPGLPPGLHAADVFPNARWQTMTIGIAGPGDPYLPITRENLLQNSTVSGIRFGFGGLTYPDLITHVEAWADPLDGAITWTVETTGVVFYNVQPTHTLFASWVTTAYARYDPPEYEITVGTIGREGFEFATGMAVRLPAGVYTITYARIISTSHEGLNPLPIYVPDGITWPMEHFTTTPDSRAWVTYTFRIGDLRNRETTLPDLIPLSLSWRLDNGRAWISAWIRNAGPAPVPASVGGFLAALQQRAPTDPPAGPMDGGGFEAWMGMNGPWLPPLDVGQEIRITGTAPIRPGRCFFVNVDVDPYGESPLVGRVWEAQENNNVIGICPEVLFLPLIQRNAP